MERDLWRLNVRLKSRQVLIDYMRYRGVPSAYALARLAGINIGVAGHLVSGRRRSCKIENARAIEEALQVPPGTFFDAKVSQIAA